MKKLLLIICYLAGIFGANGQTLQKSTLIDFCSSYLSTPAPDGNSNYWNNVNTATAGYQLALIDKTNTATNNTLQLIGAFGVNGGAAAGGLMTPEYSQLGDLAIASATGDYFYTTLSSFKVYGLNANKLYKFYIFGSRVSTGNPDTRESKYSIVGANITPVEGTVATTGIGIGTVAGGAYNGNTGNLFTSTYIQPDASGVITITVTKISGSNAYLNCLKMEEYKGSQTISFGSLSGKSVGEADYVPGATASSGYAVSYSSSNTDVATIVSGQIHLVGAGTTTITASQAGDATYDAATNVTQDLTVTARPVVSVSGNQDASIITNTYSDVVVPAGAVLTMNASKTVHILTIERGGKVTNNEGVALTATNLTINSDASGTGTFVDLNPTGGLTVSGATNVNQYLTTGRNWYVSSPVSLATSAVFNAAAASSINKLYWYDETNGSSATLNWPLISDNSSSLAVTKGYVANVDASLLAATNGVTFTGGTLNTGPITTGLNSVPSLTRSSSQAYPGYNLVGNPYPSYLDWVAASAASTNMDASIWYRTKNGGVYEFDTYNAVSGVGTSNATVVTQYIPPMQAFWVRVSAGQTTGTLALTNAMRSHESGTNRLKAATVKASVQSLLRLQVSNGVNSDQALVLFNPNASNVYDAYDSPKRSNANTAIPEIYTIAGTEHVVINGLTSVVQNQELALGFTPGSSSSFSIKAMEMSNFDTDTRIFLRDSKTNAEQDLTDGSAYTFSSDAASTATRFALVFKTSLAPTAVNEVLDEVNSIVVLKNANNQIAVTIPTELVGKGMATVYNALGQRLESLPLSGTQNVLSKAYTSGVYLVLVVANGRTTTRKVFIN